MKLRAMTVAVLALMLIGTSATCAGSDAERLRRKGDEALAAGRLADAEAAYRKGLERSPMDPILQLALGQALRRQGRTEEALEAFRRSDMLLPGWDVGLWLADTEAALGRWSECQQTCERMIGMRPRSLDALDLLGVCAERAGDHTRARDVLRDAVGIEDLPARRRWLAWAEYGVDDFAAAAAAARGALGQLPPASDAAGDPAALDLRLDLQYVLGLSELALGNLVEAERWLGDVRALGVLVDTLPEGLLVQRVFRAMPGERAGVRPGDLITACDDVALGAGWLDLTDHLRARPAGAEVRLTLRRGSETLDTVATLSLAPPPPAPPIDVAGDALPGERGVSLWSVTVEPASVAAGSPFRIVVEATVHTASGTATVPVHVNLRILQDGRELTHSDWTENLIPGDPQRLVKEVPRAAGSPGRYTVTVDLESPVGVATGSAELEILARP